MQVKRRQRWLVRLMAMGSMVAVLSASGPVQAQTTSNGPYYATPSWDQTLSPATRFILLSNFNSEAVLDRETGLVWQRSLTDPSTIEWARARSRCVRARVGNGELGWRLPSVTELMSLIDPTQEKPALPPNHPFLGVIPDGFYWSSTKSAQVPTSTWVVNMSTGIASEEPQGNDQVHIWCVRGGMNAAAY